MRNSPTQLRKSIVVYRWICATLVVITIVAWTSSAMANRDARVLLEQNKQLQHNLNTSQYQLHEAQAECVHNIESWMNSWEGRE